MDSSIKKYLAVGSSMILTTATLFGIPFKAYAHKIHEQACINESLPKVWNKHTAKT